MTVLRIENEFLQTLVNEKLAVTVFLHKHAVSTIMPAQIVSLKEEQPHE